MNLRRDDISIREIQSRIKNGESQTEIAKSYGIKQSALANWCRRRGVTLEKVDRSRSVGQLLLNAGEAAEFLGVCRVTLRKLTSPRGSIVRVRVGNRRFYSRKTLEAWIAHENALNRSLPPKTKSTSEITS